MVFTSSIVCFKFPYWVKHLIWQQQHTYCVKEKKEKKEKNLYVALGRIENHGESTKHE